MSEHLLNTIILALLIVLIMTIMVGLSTVYWVWLWRQKSQGRPLLQLEVGTQPARVFSLLGIGVLTLSVWQLSNLAQDPTPSTDTSGFVKALTINLVFHAAIYVSLLSVFLLSTRVPGGLRQAGFRGNDIGLQVFDGFKWFLLALMPVVVLQIPVKLISQQLIQDKTTDELLNPALQALMQTPLFGIETLLIFLWAVVLAPLSEELMYRVILQNWLMRWLPVSVSIGITALIFAAVHGLPDAIALIPLAVLLGTVYYYRRSYLTNVLIHAIFNFYNVAMLQLVKGADFEKLEKMLSETAKAAAACFGFS